VYIQWPSHPFLRRIEGVAHGLRKRLALGDLEPLEPPDLIRTFDNIRMLDLGPILRSASQDAALLTAHSSAWSALAYRESGGPWLVTWNPHHNAVRIRASVMEEVAHIVLNHRPTQLVPDDVTGLPRRTFSRSKEREAYAVAAAALLPYNGLFLMQRARRVVSDIAKHYAVSEQLVQYRMNVTGVAA
jgi:hypothetical protein